MEKKFNPTSAQIQAARHLFICMALNDLTKKEFHKIETQILADSNYKNVWFEKEGRPGEENEFISDPAHDYQIEGISEGSAEGTDAARYFSELDRRAKNAGFINGVNASSIIDHNVIKAETALIDVMHSITGINAEDVIMLDDRKKLIDLTLRLFAPIAKGADMEREQRKYFDSHIYTFATA